LREASLDPELSSLDKAWVRQFLLAADGDGKALDRIMTWAAGAPQTPQDEKSGTRIALEKMTDAELLAYIRKELPAAADLPNLPHEDKDV
jgi:hypothetical protein